MVERTFIFFFFTVFFLLLSFSVAIFLFLSITLSLSLRLECWFKNSYENWFWNWYNTLQKYCQEFGDSTMDINLTSLIILNSWGYELTQLLILWLFLSFLGESAWKPQFSSYAFFWLTLTPVSTKEDSVGILFGTRKIKA